MKREVVVVECEMDRQPGITDSVATRSDDVALVVFDSAAPPPPPPIPPSGDKQLAFLFTIYPSLVLTYAGQTAYLIKNPNDHDDGFYKSIPKTIYWPMFIVATLAAIVASQSLISATFSIINQSVTLDYFPRVKVVHTSSKKEGEVYRPKINYILMILCVAVILIFGDGKDIGNAFGVIVSLVMLITTILLTLAMIMIWRTPPVLVALYFIVYFVMEGVTAVSTKILQDGWIPLQPHYILIATT